ncbi:hypothetical protein [Duganella sp. HH101]|uniref:hypothetical protein n=1 Tax=Duganella sp. HH101 TaxID=1781066 RepID=UPI001E3F8398|nr:hypothetical protein [Duganella sp. HH101]
MRKLIWLAVAGGGMIVSLACAAEWSGEWKALRATYTIYSGELAEREAPTSTERSMTVAFEGQAAKELFDSIGPDSRDTCSQDKGDRERRKRGIYCTYTLKGTGRGYQCWIGLNLRTGESIPTVSC